ncbi:MAG: hypothetical protein AABX98_04290, partial [Nanoarchaeota archaeon]
PGQLEPIVHIPHCLADDVRELEKQESSRDAYRALFEEWREQVPLVKRVLDRETTFTEAYDIIYKRLGGIETLYPTSFPNEHKALIDDLQRTTALVGVAESDVLLANVVGFTTLMTAIALVTGPVYFLCNRRQATRREFLGGIAFIGVGNGLLCGSIASGLRQGYLMSQRSNAVYLDTKIQETYSIK